MPVHICTACGTSYPEASAPPVRCPICDDERQFVPRSGQGWTTPASLAAGHANLWRAHEAGLFEIRTQPHFAIGQRALLLRTPEGNILWDCLPLIDDATIELVRALGGMKAIAISHPHYYSSCQDWAKAFGCPVHLHAADRQWLMRPDPAVAFWDGEATRLGEGITLLRLGGHFPGGTVMHWAGGADGDGVILSGDIVQVVPRDGTVSFLWSYPNMLPLPAAAVTRIARALDAVPFDRIYGAFAEREILRGARQAVTDSAKRYVALLEGRFG